MKVLRTIRFDASDDNVFINAATPGELAVSGAFAFAGMDPQDIRGKTRQAFANGWLSLPGLGRATFVTITEATDDEVAGAATALVELLLNDYGAPSAEDARQAAEDEIGYALELASGKPVNTLLTVHRTMGDQGGIHEEVREIAPPGLEQPHTRVWDISDD